MTHYTVFPAIPLYKIITITATSGDGEAIGIAGDYWRQYLSPMEHPDPTVSPTPSVQSIQSSPALLSPVTPELRPGEHPFQTMYFCCSTLV